jgi:hypothetical protein
VVGSGIELAKNKQTLKVLASFVFQNFGTAMIQFQDLKLNLLGPEKNHTKEFTKANC